VSIWIKRYSGTLPIWRESSQISKAIITSTALTALSPVTRLLKPLGVHLNYQSSWITSIGKPTVRDFISYPSRLECEFARDRPVRAQKARRLLVTQKSDFSDNRKFDPGTHHGLLLVNLVNSGRSAPLERLSSLFEAENVDTGRGRFVAAVRRYSLQCTIDTITMFVMMYMLCVL